MIEKNESLLATEIYKFCGQVFERDHKQAVALLVKILQTLKKNAGLIVDESETASGRSKTENKLNTLLASAITSLFSDPAFNPNESAFRAFLVLKATINDVFGRSGYQGMEHFKGLFGEIRENEVKIRQEFSVKIFLTTTLDLIDKQILMRIENMKSDAQFLIWLSTLDIKHLFSEDQEKNLGRLLEMRDHILVVAFKEIWEVNLAASVWFHCTFWDHPDKHEIKAMINRALWLTAERHGYLDGRIKFGRNPVPGIGQKVIFVYLEKWSEGHAMQRCYGPLLASLKGKFKTVGVGLRSQINSCSTDEFDDLISFDYPNTFGGLARIVGQLRAQRPEIFFYLSIGMCPLGIQLAQLKIAPLQLMAAGHPASSYSPEIKYMLLEDRFMPSQKKIKETILSVNDTSLVKFSPPPVNLSRTYKKSSKLTVACNSMFWKLTPRFIRACALIEKRTSKELRFEFLVGADSYRKGLLEELLKRRLSDFGVHLKLPYKKYLELLGSSVLQLTPFPFGNTNSFIDAMLVGVPTICLAGDELSSTVDLGLSRMVGLPNVCRATSFEEYVSGAVELIENDPQRKEIETLIQNQNLQALFFEEDSEKDNVICDMLIELADNRVIV